MSIRRLDEASEGLGLYPFLAVLLCTMGGLIALLVALSKRTQLADAIPLAVAPASDVADASAPMEIDPADLDEKLALARQREQEFERARNAIEQRRREEESRLSHVEEHSRRLEHELAQLQVAHQRLLESEKKQSVDRQQAQRERERLQMLAQSTEEQLQELRQQATGKKSFAIVPYRGPNGTLRRPIYLECTHEGVVLQPEGIRLTSEDFLFADRAGNPLASAIRAAREHLNAQARLRGEQELPDPYPLLLIRPRGTNAYGAALTAVRSWDADFGYEFVEEDRQLDFGPSDPRLADAMHHAIEQAREREAMLAKLAPSRYARLAVGGGRGNGGRGGGGRPESRRGESGTAAGQRSRVGEASAYGSSSFDSDAPGADAPGANPGSDSLAGALPDRYGADANGPSGHTKYDEQTGFGLASTGPRGSANLAPSAPSTPSADGETGDQGVGSSDLQTDARRGSADGDGKAMPDGAASASAGAARSGANGAVGGATQGGASVSFGSSFGGLEDRSLASERGAGWALEKTTVASSPLRRPIQAVVHVDRMAILSSRHASDPALQRDVEVSFRQSADQIADQLSEALRTHVQDWGIAGRGMYWRPVLVLNVRRGAEQHAERLCKLLEESGVDVQLPATARQSEEANRRGPR